MWSDFPRSRVNKNTRDYSHPIAIEPREIWEGICAQYRTADWHDAISLSSHFTNLTTWEVAGTYIIMRYI
jgi:hypothetical protein